ncbi:hypothetical protein [Neorhizobium sp. DT-125]|uniref:hypothetical protein n=1 Tax=Neorhizobium sp. DT-125 TaxID=3396163 RepID=UPI003F19DC44
MYEIVAAILFTHFEGKDKVGGRCAEDRFYERFAYPAPRWLVNLLTYGGRA